MSGPRARLDRGFAGAAFTAADIMMMFPLAMVRKFAPRDITPDPHLRAYL
jgi:hypothetical protein